MRDEEIDLDRVRARVKAELQREARQGAQETLEDRVRERVTARMQRRRSPLVFVPIVIGIVAVVLVLSVMAAVGNVAGVVGSSMMTGFPSMFRNIPSVIWVIVSLIVLTSITRRFRRWPRSGRWGSMPRDEEIDRAIRRELRRERRRIAGLDDPYWSGDDTDDEYYDDDYEKPKRSASQPLEKRKNEPVVQLGDDGELIYDDEPQHRASRDSR
jgi:uncharacterized membrane protein